MKIFKYMLTSEKQDLLFTEIIYNIASAKICNYDIVQFEVLNESLIAKTLKAFKQAKHDGLIELFITTNEYSKYSTEIEYLLNKFPDAEYILKNDAVYSCIAKIKV